MGPTSKEREGKGRGGGEGISGFFRCVDLATLLFTGRFGIDRACLFRLVRMGPTCWSSTFLLHSLHTIVILFRTFKFTVKFVEIREFLPRHIIRIIRTE